MKIQKPNLSRLKKYGVIVLTAVLLVAAVYVNYRINSGEDVLGQNREETPGIEPAGNMQEQSSAGANYFQTFRDTRERERAKEIEYLNMIIQDERTDKEGLKDAQEKLMEIVDSIEKEFVLETQLLAQGFDDVAVTLRKGAVNVIVNSSELTSEQVAQILDVVIRETGEKAPNIKVKELKGE